MGREMQDHTHHARCTPLRARKKKGYSERNDEKRKKKDTFKSLGLVRRRARTHTDGLVQVRAQRQGGSAWVQVPLVLETALHSPCRRSNATWAAGTWALSLARQKKPDGRSTSLGPAQPISTPVQGPGTRHWSHNAHFMNKFLADLSLAKRRRHHDLHGLFLSASGKADSAPRPDRRSANHSRLPPNGAATSWAPSACPLPWAGASRSAEQPMACWPPAVAADLAPLCSSLYAAFRLLRGLLAN